MNRADRRAKKRKRPQGKDPQIEQFKQFDALIDSMMEEAYKAYPGPIQQKADAMEETLDELETGELGQKAGPFELTLLAVKMAQRFKKEGSNVLYARFLLKAGDYLEEVMETEPGFQNSAALQNQQIGLYYDAAYDLLKEKKAALAEDLLQKGLEIGEGLAKENLLYKPNYGYYGRILDWKALKLKSEGILDKADHYQQEAKKYLPESYFSQYEEDDLDDWN